MKKKFVVLGLVGAMALGTCTVSAANGTKDISATFRNIKIVVDGKELSTSAEPFIYNGTTYLPIRAVGEAVGKEVNWDAGTNTVYLGEAPVTPETPVTPEAPATPEAPTAPETPAASETTASSSLPLLKEYKGMSDKELQEYIAYVPSSKMGAWDIYETYREIINDIMNRRNAGGIERADEFYQEALVAFDLVQDARDYAKAKDQFIRLRNAK